MLLVEVVVVTGAKSSRSPVTSSSLLEAHDDGRREVGRFLYYYKDTKINSIYRVAK